MSLVVEIECEYLRLGTTSKVEWRGPIKSEKRPALLVKGSLEYSATGLWQ
jgi:hypothetical protein